MSLTARLSLFFLAALAAVLGGFSAVLYLLARGHFDYQASERLESALNTLVAVAEVGPDGVEWETAQRHLRPGDVAWLVTDDRSRVIDQTPGLSADFAAAATRTLGSSHHRLDWDGGRWLAGLRRLEAAPGPPADRPGEVRYPALTIVAAVSLAPADATLRFLAAALAVTSAAVWLAAWAGGRALARRALAPVTRMAADARAMSAADLDRRLPLAGTGDELDDLSRAFNGLLDRVGESFERQRRFTGDASHQLRTPLTAMLGQVEVALRHDRDSAEYRRVLESVRGQAQHLRRIIEALLFLARADAEAKLPDLERIDLAAWAAEHLKTWAGHERAADLRLEVAGQGFTVAAQPALLAELVNNLLDNACKYGPAGTPIVVRVGREGADVTLAVEDAGAGVAAEDRPHLFEPFFRSAAARRRGIGGLGLGLAVAARLARAFGGSLTFDGRFILRLPAA
jgi:heavy metal sensor kinase